MHIDTAGELYQILGSISTADDHPKIRIKGQLVNIERLYRDVNTEEIVFIADIPPTYSQDDIVSITTLTMPATTGLADEHHTAVIFKDQAEYCSCGSVVER